MCGVGHTPPGLGPATASVPGSGALLRTPRHSLELLRRMLKTIRTTPPGSQVFPRVQHLQSASRERRLGGLKTGLPQDRSRPGGAEPGECIDMPHRHHWRPAAPCAPGIPIRGRHGQHARPRGEWRVGAVSGGSAPPDVSPPHPYSPPHPSWGHSCRGRAPSRPRCRRAAGVTAGSMSSTTPGSTLCPARLSLVWWPVGRSGRNPFASPGPRHRKFTFRGEFKGWAFARFNGPFSAPS